MQTKDSEKRAGGRRDWLLGLALFFLAFLPRTFSLSRFLTADENLWIGRGVEFLTALSHADLAGTFQVGHPGVTTRWTAVVGMIARYFPNIAWTENQLWLGPWALSEIPDHLMEVLAVVRFPTVLLFSCLVVAVYFLGRKLVGKETALIGSVLLALDPFGLAISRVIHHDALNTIFMTASLLFFAWWLENTRGRWLVISGVMAGLAFLSKSTALFLVPVVCLMAGSYYLYRRISIPWRRLVVYLVLWGGVAALVFVALWPAMWVDPIGAVSGVIEKATGYAASPHERDNFFMGQLQPDPGPLFYPAAMLFRLTPITLIGVLLSIVALWRGFRLDMDWDRRNRSPRPLSLREERSNLSIVGDARQHESGKTGFHNRAYWLAVFWGFVILFTVFMTFGAKKFDRYLLPVFPFLDLLAAAGLLEGAFLLIGLFRKITGGSSSASVNRNWPKILIPLCVLVLVVQAWSSLPAYPYYLTAYNPLLGGIRQAAQVMLVGWGEGYDQAADYLNSQPGAENLDVATWYAKQTLPYLFKGHSWDVRANRQEPIGIFPWTQADYMVIYINQLQREIPDKETLSFFQSLEPEHVVNLAGLDYAWVYRIPEQLPDGVSPYQYPAGEVFGDKVRLLGYDVDENLTEFEGDHYLVITFYWQCLEPMKENYRLYLKLINAVYHIWGRQESYPVWDGFMTAEWEPGTIIRDVHGIIVAPGTPPGSYRVTVDWLQPYTQQTLQPEGGSFLAGPVNIPARPRPSLDDLEIQSPVDLSFSGKVRLLGYNMEGSYRPGGQIHLVLFWKVLSDFDQDYTVFNHLVDSSGRLAGQKDNQPVDGFYPTTRWEKGEIIRDQYDVPISPDAPGGVYHLEAGLYSDVTGERLPVEGSGEDKIVLDEIVIRPD